MTLGDYVVLGTVALSVAAGGLYFFSGSGDIPRTVYWWSVATLNTATIFFK